MKFKGETYERSFTYHKFVNGPLKKTLFIIFFSKCTLVNKKKLKYVTTVGSLFWVTVGINGLMKHVLLSNSLYSGKPLSTLSINWSWLRHLSSSLSFSCDSAIDVQTELLCGETRGRSDPPPGFRGGGDSGGYWYGRADENTRHQRDGCSALQVAQKSLVAQLSSRSVRGQPRTRKTWICSQVKMLCLHDGSHHTLICICIYDMIADIPNGFDCTSEDCRSFKIFIGYIHWSYLRWIKQWIGSERPITICAIVKTWLCPWSRISPQCDITRRQRPIGTLVMITLQRNLHTNMHRTQLLGYLPAARLFWQGDLPGGS